MMPLLKKQWYFYIFEEIEIIKRFNKKGFTLVEIIVVLVILAILAAIAVPSVLGYVEEAKKEKYIAEAKAIYTVIQVEEARLENEIDYTDKGDSYHNMEDMYTKLRNKTADNPDGENIIAKKTGIKSMDFIYSGDSDDSGKDYVYLLHWTSDDGKKIQAELYKNKQVKITSIE